MIAADDRRTDPAVHAGTPLAIVSGGGSLPFAVANSAMRNGRGVVLMALRNSADPQSVENYPHHWVRAGQIGRCISLIRSEGCRDVVFIGGLVRPTLAQLWPDFGAIRHLPRLLGSFRGGDGHLLSNVAHVFEAAGLRIVGAHEIAPEIMIPSGPIGIRRPREQDQADIERGLAYLQAAGPFDVGQAVVVAENRILAVEAAEGTDAMLARLADLRGTGAIQSRAGIGVLVKAPKPGQDQRIDLPSIGPKTVDGAKAAGLVGIAVVAGSTIAAEPEQLAAAADRAGLFVIGVGADGITK
jgi:UDP-2,3-diacylglucosamine hydrolase